MSGPLALAAATAVLRELLQTGVSAMGLSASLSGGEVVVSVGPPDLVVREGVAAVPQLNLFLWQVSRNAAWINRDQPARDSRGERISNPALALDLGYVISAWGVADYEAEMLLGAAMLVLHDTPGLGRDFIAEALTPGPTRPAVLAALQAAGLDQQADWLKITPAVMTADDLSRLWSAFDTPFRPCAAFTVTVLLMEGEQKARRALPVRQRGIVALPMAPIRIDRVVNAAGDRLPVTAGSTLRIIGRGLGSSDASVFVAGPGAPEGIDLSPAITLRAADELRLTLPALLPAGLRAGPCVLQVVLPVALGAPPLPHEGFASNVAGFVLAPQVLPAVVAGGVSLTCTPPLGARQRVRLLLNESGAAPGAVPRAYAFEAPAGNGVLPPATETATVTIATPGVVAGSYLVRVQVDGAESVLGTDAAGHYNSPEVLL